MRRYKIYEHSIAKGLKNFPKEICFMLDEEDVISSPQKLWDVVSWAGEFKKIGRLIFHISCPSPKSVDSYVPLNYPLKKSEITIISRDGEKKIGSGAQKVMIVIGRCGTDEICDAIIKIAKEGIEPDKIDESVIESHLSYQVNPDFVIKTGKNHLTDFLIWQSVYSELLFTDVNWDNLRRVDFLRALRDFETRTRRYGK